MQNVKANNRLRLVTCSIDMRFLPGKMDEVVQMLVSAVGRTEANAGCKECVVARDAAETGRVRYSEVWNSETAFQRHLRSSEFQHVLMAMDLCCEEPQVMIGDLSGRRGIAYLQELRERSKGSVK